jgi:predicted GIY-YIG superfamily endonuclease
MYVYILKCVDGSYYTGTADNLMRRIKIQKSGEDGSALWVRSRLPVELVYAVEGFHDRLSACKFARYIKSFTRAKKEALINGDENVVALARKRIKIFSPDAEIVEYRYELFERKESFEMNTNRAIEIVSKLADGINPYTGESFKPDSAYQHPDTVRALYKAKEALERLANYERRQENLPENAGVSWSQEEEERLVKAFDKGTGIKDLAKLHKRTEGAIKARLARLGKIEH